eukprot:scaffold2283_cov104-Isochrysis_galbana.AAC.4
MLGTRGPAHAASSGPMVIMAAAIATALYGVLEPAAPDGFPPAGVGFQTIGLPLCSDHLRAPAQITNHAEAFGRGKSNYGSGGSCLLFKMPKGRAGH